MSSTSPEPLRAVAAKVDVRLDRLFAEQSAQWTEHDPRLAEAVDELVSVMSSGGKRLRAGFCYWAWRGAAGAGADERVIIDVGAAFELLQTFALIHDDIMDDSDTRRGRPTVHVRQADRLRQFGWQGEPRRFGEGVAILVGDLSHAYADALMAETPPQARRIWDDLRIELNLGQYLDLRSAAAGELDRETAHRVSTFKSALYTIVRPLQLGATVGGGVDANLHATLDDFGRPLGRAFQLRDDLLGVLGDSERIGKPVGDDLREGKPTELVAYAVDKATPAQAAVLAEVGRRDLSATDVDAMVTVLIDTGAVAEIERRIATLVGESEAVLPQLPFDNDAQDALAALAKYVAARNI